MFGSGKLQLTGQLGDVMKESAQAALSYVRTNAEKHGIPKDFLEKSDLHIHIPAGAMPKDGPSAGITMFTALVSLLTGIRVRHDVAMTGEISLRGRVLPIGGLKEKIARGPPRRHQARAPARAQQGGPRRGAEGGARRARVRVREQARRGARGGARIDPATDPGLPRLVEGREPAFDELSRGSLRQPEGASLLGVRRLRCFCRALYNPDGPMLSSSPHGSRWIFGVSDLLQFVRGARPLLDGSRR